MKSEYILLDVNDGSKMRAYVVSPKTQAIGAVILLQEAYGVNGHIRKVAGRLTDLGYHVIAPELYHRVAPEFEGDYSNPEPSITLLKKLKDAELECDLKAAYDWLLPFNLPVAAMGFCMGGKVACLAAITLPLACGISFYGGGIAAGPNGPGLMERLPQLEVPMLFFWGGGDKAITGEQSHSVTLVLKAANKKFVNVEFSEAEHAFFNDERENYHPMSAEAAWGLTTVFLKQQMKIDGNKQL